MDSRLDPDRAHPLNMADCVRSNARLADLQLGMICAGDDYWRDKAKARVEVLKLDGQLFGLMPHEEAELEQLESMLADANERLASNG